MPRLFTLALTALFFTAAPATAKVARKTTPAVEKATPAPFSLKRDSASVESMDARAAKKFDEAIGKLERLLQSLPENARTPDLLFRLAELYWKKAKFLELQAMREWDDRLEEWHRGGPIE